MNTCVAFPVDGTEKWFTEKKVIKRACYLHDHCQEVPQVCPYMVQQIKLD